MSIPTKKRFEDKAAFTVAVHGATWAGPNGQGNTSGYYFIAKVDEPDKTTYGITDDFNRAEIVGTIDELADLLGRIQKHENIYEKNGDPINDFILTPIVLNVSVSDASMEVGTVAHNRKRKAALAKLSDEEREILGLNPFKAKTFIDNSRLGDTSWDLP